MSAQAATGAAGAAGAADSRAASPNVALVAVQDEPPTLVRLLLEKLERLWHKEGGRRGASADTGAQIAVARLVTRGYLRRRVPDEMEAVLATLDAGAMDLIQAYFGGQALNLHQFVESFVQTGTYDADRIVAFIGGIVDLFLEILRSQSERAVFNQIPLTVNWAQVMNHFIESPEISMFEGSEGGILGTKVASSTDKQPSVQRNKFVDRAKHQSCGIEKIYWNSYVDTLVTVEGNESVYFFSPHAPGLDAPRAVLTPQLGPRFYDYEDKPLYFVHAVAWDEELQDVVALLSNRMLIFWRLRNREKCQWQQKRELKFAATRHETRGLEKGPQWDLRLLIADSQTGADVHAKKKPDYETEVAMRRDLGEIRMAEEAAEQLDIWWNSHLKAWITTDNKGQLCLWNLRVMEGAWMDAYIAPTSVLREHTALVTSHLELNKNKFTTISLDRSVILWDHRNLTPEMKLQGGGAHTAAVISQAYLPRFNSLVTVGCEKKIFVWTIDSTAYRGMKGKLSGHQANVVRVSAGQRVFFSLDEAFSGILWDGSTLASLQTVSCTTFVPRHCTCLPEHGTICLSGRRLNFVEGNEVAAEKLGKPLTKEQQANALNKAKEGASLKDSAAPRYCGLSLSRGYMLSATEVEVRLHARSNPGLSRALFNAAEGESITTFAASDKLSWAVFGTSKGAIHFLKYRSGFPMKVYPGRKEGEEWQGGGAGAASSEAAGGEAQDRQQKGGRGPRAGATPSGADGGRSSSPTAGAGNRSPQSAAGKGGLASPLNAQTPGGGLNSGDGGGGEDDGAQNAGDAARRAARRDVGERNAPTQEEIQRGLSSNITCVFISESWGRVYVGTAEGQVLVFTAEAGFPILRWLNNPDDPSAVTCMTCGLTKEANLLVVGTQDGAVHLYTLGQLRIAGSINIARLLFEGEAGAQGAALRHVKLFSIAYEPKLPLTLLTVDMSSRVRLWGLEVHDKSGKLNELKLLVDGGQLREIDCIPPASRILPKPKKKADGKPGKNSKEKEAKEGDGGAAATAGGSDPPAEAEGAVSFIIARSASQELVRLSAVATFEGTVTLPTRALAKQHRDGPTRAEEKEPIAPAKAAKIGAEADPKRKEKEQEEAAAAAGVSTFLTSIGSAGTARSTPKSVGNPPAAFPEHEEDEEGNEDEEGPPEFSGSETEGEADEVVGRRHFDRPPSPKPPPLAPPGVSEAEHAAAYAPVTVDGSNLVFLADSGGWIWCVDVAATVEMATARASDVGVILDPLAARGSTARKPQGGLRTSLRLAASSHGGSVSSAPQISTSASGAALSFDRRGASDDHGPVLAKPLSSVKAQPDAFKVVGAWPAHLTAVLSLVPVSSPSALVSTDASKEVKVWSTAGDLWGHFSLRGLEGAQPPVAIWPPPHALATQVALMRTAKATCRRMGFHTTKADEIKAIEEKQRLAKKTQLQRHARQRSQEQIQLLSIPGAGRGQHASSGSSSTGADPRDRLSSAMTTGSSVELGEGAQGGAAGAKGSGAADAAAARGADSVKAARFAGSGGAGEDAAAKGAAAADAGDGGDASPAGAPPAAAGEEGSDAGDASAAEGGEGRGQGAGSRKKKRTFSQSQLKEMVRNHAFSSGFQTYKQFIRKVEPARSETAWRSRNDAAAQLDAQRKTFFAREASAFGIELSTGREADNWDATVRGLPSRSASEGALLRYAHGAVEDMTRSVHGGLGVDVSKVTRRQIKRQSFAASLDIGGVSSNPADPMSATGQAVRKLCPSTVSLPPVNGDKGARVRRVSATGR